MALIEIYDLSQDASATLANISTRGFVQVGDQIMIGGFIVGGSGGTKVLVRAMGPSLGAAGVPGALTDPTLELRDGNGALTASNDNWRSDKEAEIQATALAPGNDAESAILATLGSGSYTAIVRGKNNTSGVGLVEFYRLQ